ncbi:methylmalonate-semialdehyde dehydrogenase (acylating) [Oleiphilus sp. HI0071]|jgi:malonate-semialdehyde dehydrogenase (acetylating)/methylmalonate-semialdehyde dehydrogenase|nr:MULTISPECIES: CoA-acylating methylmalonate-semialdehyde dehydrogenase [unclassified Oleiphilus]KZY68083.1 methylmalonate-semialdehyde dehydrogenase (acylating) [Oleiphilus sp. HI0065]KZY78414.1 methylmalonate-semialdehyde dehydrogenase (acylating) [Oleiphilus sp. HI0071]KZY97176.1 methylmalonate-semialdehyde dehydrogenase (acylating) [Oleiphilus sp. HI0073]KZZ51669.1 methylmalonate-semialdehyde dehydrogenase (acylating) [Oleiphilus sp. HI0122]KZZ54840.1 methylmalonate-semialdehyde dehydroge
MTTINHYVNGQETGPSARSHNVFNPATGEQIAEVSLASATEVESAIAIAQKTFETWSQTTPLSRARILFKFKAIVDERRDELAAVITAQHGKVYEDALGEITRGLEVVEFACGIPSALKGEFTEQVGGGIDAWSTSQPLGVVAGITPFNFPAMVPMWMWPVAIACGNTVVMKPSEKNPTASMLMAEWMKEAGLPDGVLNVVNGDKEAVDVLLTHKDIQAVSFVGSTPIAEYIYSTASANGKRVQALGGAKNHMIVMPDADIDGAVNALIGAAYGSAGERCMAISVALAVGDIADELVAKLAEKTKALKIGDGSNKGLDMGPLISKEHLEKVKGYIAKGVEEGATLVVDGREAKIDANEKGYFLGGCLFDNVTKDMVIYQEEIFGPVLCVVRVPDYSTAVQMINDHEYGNGTSIYTRSGGIARKFTHDVQVGMVGVNVPIPVPMAFHSFGGWKRSLFGANHMHGPEGVKFYTKRKAVTARWPEGDLGAEFVMPTMK